MSCIIDRDYDKGKIVTILKGTGIANKSCGQRSKNELDGGAK